MGNGKWTMDNRKTERMGETRSHILRSTGILLLLAIFVQRYEVLGGVTEADTVLHAGQVEEIRYRSASFDVVGNLYLPSVGHEPYPLSIWVGGSGPGFRTVQQNETKKFVNCFLDRGFAYFMIDKPGSGDSQGALHDDSVFAQMSRIVVDAATTLRAHPRIDARRIGLVGSSQAGYIMPIVISQNPDISFMIGLSCPGENSIEQWNYLIERQMVCEGVPPERARKSADMFFLLRTTDDRQKFDEALSFFEKHPILIKSVGYDSLFSRQLRDWWPRTNDERTESRFNPMTLVRKIRIPLFLAFGERDTQIDPRQAAEAYRNAAAVAGNEHVAIRLFAHSDHNLKLSGGCVQEIRRQITGGDYRYDPEFLHVLGAWIDGLAKETKM